MADPAEPVVYWPAALEVYSMCANITNTCNMPASLQIVLDLILATGELNKPVKRH